MRRRETVPAREHYYVIFALFGMGFVGFVVEVMRRLAELNGHHEEIKDNQSKSVTQEVFNRKSETDAVALKLALEQVDAELGPLKDFRSRAYGMGIVLALVAAALGAFIVKALG